VTDSRAKARDAFVARFFGRPLELIPLAGDASFRRYFRLRDHDRCFVLMDAPPPHEDLARFLRIAKALRDAGVRVPFVFAADEAQGFALIEDFGDRTWALHLAAGGAPDPLIDDAWQQLLRLQQAFSTTELPAFDAARMHAELDLYLDWYLPRVAGIRPSARDRASFHAAFAPLIDRLLQQPRVAAHLDYHSRNLMLPPQGLPLGVIDFQDAAIAHASYDAASLLYDCYQDYGEERRRDWSEALFAALPASIRRFYGDFDAWHLAVRQAALQRHIKAIGIFARLAHRDGKRNFLSEIPLTRKHLAEELEALGKLGVRHPLLDAPPLFEEEPALAERRA